jgi:hypothetical protein
MRCFQAHIEQLGKMEDSLNAARSAELDADSVAAAERLQREIAEMLLHCQVCDPVISGKINAEYGFSKNWHRRFDCVKTP